METEELFDKLVDEKLGLLRNAAFRVLKSQADADDAVQSALLKAWARRDSFRGEADLGSWTYRIAVNEAFDILRKRRREDSRREEFALLKTENAPKATLDRLDALVAALPSALREAVELIYMERMPSTEAAKVLACDVNALYQRLHKAKSLLKERLRDE